jgi:hypothetical protein
MSQLLDSADSVIRAVRTAERHWYEDGISSIVAGLSFLIVAATSHLVPFPRFSIFGAVLHVAVYGIFLALCIAQRRIVDWLKRRISYPRSGYTPPPPSAVGIKLHDTGFWPAPPPTPMEQDYLDRQEKLKMWMVPYYVAMMLAILSGGWWFSVGGSFLGLIWFLAQPDARTGWLAPLAYLTLMTPNRLIPQQQVRVLTIIMFLLGGITLFRGLLALNRYLRKNPLRQMPQT